MFRSRSRSILCAVAGAAVFAFAAPASAEVCQDCNDGGGGGGGTTYTTPATTLSAAPASPINVKRPATSYSSDLSSSYFQCRWAASAGEAWNTGDDFDCGSAATANQVVSFTPGSDLADGQHHLQVRACKNYSSGTVTKCDATAVVASWTQDTVAPGAVFGDASPADGAHLNAAGKWILINTENPFTPRLSCSVDAVVLACSDQFTYGSPSVGQGEHVIAFTAADAAGNVSGVATRTFVWDTIAPVTTVTAPAKTTSKRPAITFAATDADTELSVACKLDGVAVPCSGTSFTPSADLALGKHTFEVQHTDRASNAGTAVSKEIVVEEPPVVTNPGGTQDQQQPQPQTQDPVVSNPGGQTVQQPSTNDGRGVTTVTPAGTKKPTVKKTVKTPAVCKTIKKKKGAARKRAIKACAKAKKAAAKKAAAKKAKR
jgi:hypothetical protein